MNRSKWWLRQYYNHITGIGSLPSISKIEISLHTSTQGLIENDTDIIKDTFPTELQYDDYKRQILTINPISMVTDNDIIWSVSEDNWTSINAVGFIGTCILSNNVYTKCIWYKILSTSLTKASDNIIFIPKNEVIFV